MYPVFLSPHSDIASSLMGSTASVCVFWERRRMANPPSESCSISSHFNLRISLIRKPVKHEKSDAAFNTGNLHGYCSAFSLLPMSDIPCGCLLSRFFLESRLHFLVSFCLDKQF